MKRTTRNNPRRGGRFDEFLREQHLAEEVEALAGKEMIAWKLDRAMKEQNLTVSTLARRMKTSRVAVDRILNPHNPSVTLRTLERAARALGKRWKIDLVEA